MKKEVKMDDDQEATWFFLYCDDRMRDFQEK